MTKKLQFAKNIVLQEYLDANIERDKNNSTANTHWKPNANTLDKLSARDLNMLITD